MADRETPPPAPAAGPPKGRRDLTQGKIAPTLLAFALPTLGSSILQSLNGSINAIWVGRYLGSGALAATSNANIIMFLLSSFVFGFSMAATILIGQAFGRRDVDGARRVVGTAVGAFAAVALVIAVVGWLAAPAILDALGTPESARADALAYLRVIFIAMPPLLLLFMFMMALRGSGDSLTPLWFMIVSVILDSGLNPVFILGLGPAPRLGIAGSATATVVANWVAFLALIAFIYIRDLPLRLKGHELGYIRPDWRLLRTIVGKGLPMGIQMIVISASAVALFGRVNAEGIDTAAAFGVAMQLWGYVQMPAMALGAAVSGMAAQNIGAGRWDRLGAITRTGIIFHFVITGTMVLVLFAADRFALGLFLPEGSGALPIAQHIHALATWNFLLFGVVMVLFGTVRANGAVIGPLVILTIGLVPVRFGWIWLTEGWLGADAIWTSFPVASIANLAMAWAFYAHGGWRKGRIAVPPTEHEAREQSEAQMEPGGRLHPTG